MTPSGDAGIDIPVELPPGVNGLQPQLELSYNSSRVAYLEPYAYGFAGSIYYPGDTVGLGWQLKGLPTIHLCHTNEAIGDRELFNLRFYCLDGQRLIRKGTSKDLVLENNPQVKVKHVGETTYQDGYFEVYQPDGSVWTFGGDYGADNPGYPFDSHVPSDPQTLSTTRYALSHIRDADGNEAHFGWVRLCRDKSTYCDPNGETHFISLYSKEIYPKEITYGHNQDTRIVFDYADRFDGSDLFPDWTPAQAYGSLQSNLSGINILQKDSSGSYQPVSQYILYHDYPNDLSAGEIPHRALRQVQRCGYNADGTTECYAPIKIDWQKVEAGSEFRYVNKITGSLGAATEFDIVKMGDAHPEAYFSERPFGEGIAPPGSETTQANKVVAMRTSNGLGGTNTLRYAYQGDAITIQEGPWQPDRMTQHLGMFAQRVINALTGQVTYVQNFVDKPYLGKIAQIRNYTDVYQDGGTNTLISVEENHYAHEVEDHGYRTAKAPYLKTSTRYAYENGNLVVVNQFDNEHSFTGNLIDETTLTIQAATGATPGAAGSFWGDKAKATLSGVLRTTVTQTDVENRSGDTHWLTGFAVSGTTRNYHGDSSSGRLDSEQSFTASPYLLTNKINAMTRFAGDTELALTTTLGYGSNGLTNTATLNGAHVAQRSNSITAFQDGRYPSTISNALGHTISRVYDNRFGLVTSATDVNLQTTRYGYNALGQATSITSPDNVVTTTERQFCAQVTCEPVGTVTPVYRLKISSPLLADQWRYFDRLGRLVRVQAQQFDGSGGDPTGHLS